MKRFIISDPDPSVAEALINDMHHSNLNDQLDVSNLDALDDNNSKFLIHL
jgi:hypothetical protein